MYVQELKYKMGSALHNQPDNEYAKHIKEENAEERLLRRGGDYFSRILRFRAGYGHDLDIAIAESRWDQYAPDC